MAKELFLTPLFSDASLQAYYRLENLNDSKNSFTLTNTGATAFNAALFGNGADFGATNSTKNLSISSQLGHANNADCTESFWVKLQTEIGSGIYVLYHRVTASYDVTIRYNFNGGTRRLEFFCGNFGAQVNYTVTLGTTNWTHIALTRNQATGIFHAYVNGVDVGNATDSGTNPNVALFVLASQSVSPTNSASAIMDDTATFSRQLSATDISNIFTGIFGGNMIGKFKE